MTDPVRIGNAQGFWGDRGDAAAELLAQEPQLDFLTLDYLAEVSLSIMALQQQRDPQGGFARDFLAVVQSLIPYWNAGGTCKLITNAGGLNPRGCAQAVRQTLEDAGCRAMKIGIVAGDSVREDLQQAPENPLFADLDTGESLGNHAEKLLTANAYVGADSVVEALRSGAEIIVTGRVADPSMVVAPCVFHFDWPAEDWNRLAGATVAGHLIECGTQVTGGISTDWLDLAGPSRIAFPIVEVNEDGTCVVTKSPRGGGIVNLQTTKEQLVYEIGDPANYISPDCRVSFANLAVEQIGEHRVRVSGATGSAPTETYKVSATWHDGYRAAGSLTIIGRDAAEKARRAGEVVLDRVEAAGCSLRNSLVEAVGSGEVIRIAHGTCDNASETTEVVMRIAVEADDKVAVEQFCREIIPLVTAGPPGTTGYAEGRPRPHRVFRYWPCLVPRDRVKLSAEITESNGPTVAETKLLPTPTSEPEQPARTHRLSRHREILHDFAHARSGDKGINANIGVIARDPADYGFLLTWLTPDRVASCFRDMGITKVERFELPNLHAVNFLVHGILSNKLRTDAQGKALGQMLLMMPLESEGNP